MNHPGTGITSEAQLEAYLSEPPEEVIAALSKLDGDILILGIAGKIGITLGMMASRAIRAGGIKKRVIGVSRFSEPGGREKLEAAGVETISCDLLDRAATAELPEAENIVFMAGKKFGTGGSEELTWAMNTVAPGNAASRYPESRFVVYSTGCVYDFASPAGGGSVESDPPCPVGDYAQSALGRERVFQYYSTSRGTPVCILRLNYAVDLRYGVLRDIAEKVRGEETIDLSTGNFNCIWQGDVLSQTLLSFGICSSPAEILNMTGPETVSVRWAAEEFGKRFGKIPRFTGREQDRVYLNNAAKAAAIFGYPRVPLMKVIDLTAEWIKAGGSSLGKPTHFEVRDGKY
jgi:nucleoside-diphosphate-sugar epimerase